MNSQRKLQIPEEMVWFKPLFISPSDPPQELCIPRHFYHLTLASTLETQLETYIKVETWFLATLRAKYNPSTPAIPLISKSQAR